MRIIRMFNAASNQTTKYIIKDMEIPACATCKHFIPYVSPLLYSDKDVDIMYSKCRMFGYRDRVSGKIFNHFAYVCRGDYTMCDKNGIHYVPINPVKCSKEERFT